MGIEIERKFLVKSDQWKSQGKGKFLRQGYILNAADRSVRIRIQEDKAFLTIKGDSTGISRAEYEYAIPISDAQNLLDTLCDGKLIEKIRYKIPLGKHVWEVDEFMGANQGLVIAEIELCDENETFERPDWLGAEVSDDPRYLNARLIQNPFKNWKSTF